MSSVRYRRNINCLTEDQLHDLREALAEIYTLPVTDPHSFEVIAGLHGNPSPQYCIHGVPGFLTWHRAYLYDFENALQCINPNIMAPFWDWSSSPTIGLPPACREPTYINRSGDTVPNPLFSGPLPASAGSGQTSRNSNVDSVSFEDLANTAQSALTATSFNSFQNSINGPHGSVHVRIGGSMGSVPYAGFDPIFYLHHANVDRLWAEWQKAHPLPLPINERDLELPPFNKPYSSAWKTGADFEYTDSLGYRYTTFCFFFPELILRVPILVFIDPSWIEKKLQSARLLLRSNKMPANSMEIRVFVNQPNANVRSRTFENPNYMGSFGIFGMGMPMKKGEKPSFVQHEQSYDMELDITHNLKRLLKETIDAKDKEPREEEISLLLVPVDIDGKSIATEEINIQELEMFME